MKVRFRLKGDYRVENITSIKINNQYHDVNNIEKIIDITMMPVIYITGKKSTIRAKEFINNNPNFNGAIISEYEFEEVLTITENNKYFRNINDIINSAVEEEKFNKPKNKTEEYLFNMIKKLENILNTKINTKDIRKVFLSYKKDKIIIEYKFDNINIPITEQQLPVIENIINEYNTKVKEFMKSQNYYY